LHGYFCLVLGSVAVALSAPVSRAQNAPPAITFHTGDASATPNIAFRTGVEGAPEIASGSNATIVPPPSIGFRNDAPAVQSDALPIPQQGGNISPAGEAQQEMDDFTEQKQTLDSELRYARAQLDNARKRLDVESIAGHAEAADKWQQEVTDWQDHIKSLQTQLAQLDTEIQGVVQQMTPAAPTPENIVIVPGDNLELWVNEDPSFNNRYEVRSGGYIILPAVGRIAVAGKTLPDAENEVKKALEATQLIKATVMLEKVEGQTTESGPVIYLYGEFKNPRPYKIPPGTKATVTTVFLSSGGATDQADLTRVKVMRMIGNKPVVDEENLQKILDGSGLGSDLSLLDGDVISIPIGSANVVFVTGKVEHPGTLPLKPGSKLSAYAAILDSGGFSRFADLKKTYILRASPDGTKVKIPVNIIAIQHGRAADLPLEDNDIVIVPEKFFSF